ncbi:hypothetical protein [Novosphingobium acidiphilum]|uniref:hypothetical protein n=1 Tax=Novosphingobium acidiphilum TaxID=505248 RepID=UPI0003FA03AE|nr:hypothetical protein [Novosphingobium acidiphilum]
MRLCRLACVLALVLPGVALARDRLGVWNDWGAFRDAAVPRCYAIAMAIDQPRQKRDAQPYFTVANWPRRGIRGEIHARLSREAAAGKPVTITIGGQRFAAVVNGFDIWATDRRGDAAIIAALRSDGDMTITARGRDGRPVRDIYHLAGAASAMDAASLGCAAS